MNRKLLALVVAIFFVISMAVVVSAYSFNGSGAYDGCYYGTFANCEYTTYHALIELTGFENGDYSHDDYIFQTTVTPYVYQYGEIVQDGYARNSLASYYISSLDGQTDWRLARIDCVFRINGNAVSRPSVSAP